jgi:hypothetical protein
MRGAHEKPNVLRPLRHRLCVIAWPQAAPHEVTRSKRRRARSGTAAKATGEFPNPYPG